MEWISVKDRLPEIGIAKDFFGLVSDGRSVITAWYWRRRYNSITEEKEDIWSVDKTSQYMLNDKITHWMPLPKPPA